MKYFDNEHYVRVKSHKQVLESSMIDPLFNQDEHLNRTFTLDEVTKVIMAANLLSALGIDNIPYAVLISPPVIAVLHNLFQLILYTSLIPPQYGGI